MMFKNVINILVIFFSCHLVAMEDEPPKEDLALLNRADEMTNFLSVDDRPENIGENKLPKLPTLFWTTGDLVGALSKLEKCGENPECRYGTEYIEIVKKIVLASGLVEDSYHFKKNLGPERAKALAEKYNISPAKRDALHKFISSLVRDTTCLRAVGAFSIISACILIGLIVDEHVKYQQSIDMETLYARSSEFIQKQQSIYGRINFNPSACYQQCFSTRVSSAVDGLNSIGYCEGNNTAIENFHHITESLFNTLKANCSLEKIPYSLNDFTKFANDIIKKSCSNNTTFYSSAIGRVENTDNIIFNEHGRINFLDEKNMTMLLDWLKFQFGPYDPQCVAEHMVSEPSPLWVAISTCSSPFVLLAMMLFAGFYVGF